MKRPDTPGLQTFVALHGGKLTCLLLAIATLLVYAQAGQFDFVNYDDIAYVTENPGVLGGLTGQGVAWAFTAFHHGNWHPLTWLSHMLDVQLFGLNAGAHHLVNVGLHVINALLLFYWLRLMTGCLWRSAFVAALFALHPLHVESVAWIAERKDVLSTFFWLWALLLYSRYVNKPSGLRYLGVFAAMALGLMSKPMVVTLPFVLLLLDYWPLRRSEASRIGSELSFDAVRGAWPLVREKIPLFALAAAACVVAYLAQQDSGAVIPRWHTAIETRMGNAALSYATYLIKTFVPLNLAVIYPYPDSLPTFQVALAVLALAGITYFAIKWRKLAPYLPVGWLWFVGTLVPVIGLVQIGVQALADRYTYIPLVGVFIVLAWGLVDLAGRFPRIKFAAISTIVVLMPLMMALSHDQVGYWRNSITLFQRALAVTTENPVAHNNLGQALAKAGDTVSAIEHFEAALKFKYGQEIVHENLGNAYLQQGQTQKAIQHYQAALHIKPSSEFFHNNLGQAYEKLGDRQKALFHYQTALQLKPDFAAARYNLGTLYFNAGDFETAVQHYLAVLQMSPQSVETLNSLGLAYEKLGSRGWAIKHYERAIQVDPGFAKAHGNLGVALLRAGDIEAGILRLQQALELDPGYELARQNLEKALKLYPDVGRD